MAILKWLGTVGVGHTVKQIEEVLFDWILYAAVITWATTTYGVVWGAVVTFLILTPFSAVMCLFYLVLYDWSRKDWFGFEAVKELRDDVQKPGFMAMVLRVMLRTGNLPAFIALSVHFDPFMTVVYMRKSEDRYHGLSGRDWKIFWSSLVVANGYWTLRWAVLVQVGVYLFALLPISIQDHLLTIINYVLQLWDYFRGLL